MDYNIQTKTKAGYVNQTQEKPLTSGELSLYLDNWNGEQRQYEFLKLYLYPRPKNALEKEHNKETLKTAENIRAKWELLAASNDEDKSGSISLTTLNSISRIFKERRTYGYSLKYFRECALSANRQQYLERHTNHMKR